MALTLHNNQNGGDGNFNNTDCRGKEGILVVGPRYGTREITKKNHVVRILPPINTQTGEEVGPIANNPDFQFPQGDFVKLYELAKGLSEWCLPLSQVKLESSAGDVLLFADCSQQDRQGQRWYREDRKFSPVKDFCFNMGKKIKYEYRRACCQQGAVYAHTGKRYEIPEDWFSLYHEIDFTKRKFDFPQEVVVMSALAGVVDGDPRLDPATGARIVEPCLFVISAASAGFLKGILTPRDQTQPVGPNNCMIGTQGCSDYITASGGYWLRYLQESKTVKALHLDSPYPMSLEQVSANRLDIIQSINLMTPEDQLEMLVQRFGGDAVAFACPSWSEYFPSGMSNQCILSGVNGQPYSPSLVGGAVKISDYPKVTGHSQILPLGGPAQGAGYQGFGAQQQQQWQISPDGQWKLNPATNQWEANTPPPAPPAQQQFQAPPAQQPAPPAQQQFQAPPAQQQMPAPAQQQFQAPPQQQFQAPPAQQQMAPPAQQPAPAQQQLPPPPAQQAPPAQQQMAPPAAAPTQGFHPQGQPQLPPPPAQQAPPAQPPVQQPPVQAPPAQQQMPAPAQQQFQAPPQQQFQAPPAQQQMAPPAAAPAMSGIPAAPPVIAPAMEGIPAAPPVGGVPQQADAAIVVTPQTAQNVESMQDNMRNMLDTQSQANAGGDMPLV